MNLPRATAIGFCALALAFAGGEAAADDAPVEFKDPNGVFTLMLPFRWKSDPSEVKAEPVGVMLAFFKGWFSLPDSETPHAILRILSIPANARARLAFGALHEPFGTEIEGTRLVGADFAESARLGLGGTADAVVVRRCIEKDGAVLCAEFLALKQSWDDHHDTIRALLDSIRITGKPPGLKAPAGFKLIAEKDFEVWTDAGQASKPVVSTLEMIRKAWATAREQLQGDAFGGPRARFVLYSKDDAYKTGSGTADVSSNAYVDGNGVAHLNLSKFGSQIYVPKVRVAAAMLSTRTWFGGEIPFFYAEGLAFLATGAVESDGKPAKLPGARLSLARNAVKETGDQTLAALLDKGWKAYTKDEAASHIAWAWHQWFRLGDATADDKKLYENAAKSLRADGDVRAWRAVWGEADHVNLAARFHAWMTKWKP